MTAILFTADLLGTSQFTAAGARTGVETVVAMNVAELLEKAAGCDPVFLDLATPGLDVAAVVGSLRGLDPPPGTIIAFGPHVQTETLAAASQAGCDAVLARGEFHARLDALLNGAAG